MRSFRGRGGTACVATAALIAAAACAGRTAAPGATAAAGAPTKIAPALPARAAPPGPGRAATSLFDQPWVWTDETGAPVRFGAWRGTPVFIGMIYATCGTVCPLTVEKLRQLSDAVARDRRRAEFVLVTLDPDADSLEHLRGFRASRGLPADWHLLRGTPEQTQALAELLRLKIMNLGDHIIHEARIAILDPEGILVGHVRG